MLKVDRSKLTAIGSLNIVTKVHRTESGAYQLTYLCPRKGYVETSADTGFQAAKLQILETIERMKIAINNFEKALVDGIEPDSIVNDFWELENELETCPNWHNNNFVSLPEESY